MDLILFELKNIFLPETVLLIFIVTNLLFALFFGRKLYKFSGRFAIIATIIPMSLLGLGLTSSGYTVFSESYIQTNFTLVLKVLILTGTFFAILLSQNITQKIRHRSFEYHSLLLISAFAAMCLVSSNDFVSMFVALETLAVSCCLLVGFWNKYPAKEAALKYVINSAIATGILLFGIGYLYGISGEINFSQLNIHYYAQDNSALFLFAVVFILVGLSFKTGCIPFQRWIPDVYQGSPYPIAAYLSTVPIIAGFGIMARIIDTIMTEFPILQFVLAFVAFLTIAYGLLGAIKQSNIKRLLGYSSVAHSGFMLLALSVFSSGGTSAFLYYAITYLFMNYGAWSAGITFVACTGSDEIKDYKGLFYVRPYYTTAFVICLLSLAGLPPTAGFVSKLYLYTTIARTDGSGLPILLVVVFLTIFGIYLYLNLTRIMFDKVPNPNCRMFTEQMNTKVVLYFCTLAIILAFFFADKIIAMTMIASNGI